MTQADTCSLLRLVTKTPHSGKSPQSLPGVGGGGGSAGAQSLQDSGSLPGGLMVEGKGWREGGEQEKWEEERKGEGIPA